MLCEEYVVSASTVPLSTIGTAQENYRHPPRPAPPHGAEASPDLIPAARNAADNLAFHLAVDG